MHDPNDIGQTLSLARKQRDETVRDVSHHTRIPMQTIEALEKNDYSGFSSPTYAKSFLAQYCDYLDVDAEAWLDSFESGDTLANLDDYAYLQGDHDVVGERDASGAAPQKPGEKRQVSNSRNFTGPAIAFLVGVAAVGGILYAIKALDTKHAVPAAAEEVVTTPAADEPAAGLETIDQPIVETPEGDTPAPPANPVPPTPAPEPVIEVQDTPPPVAVPVEDPDLLPPAPVGQD